MSRQYGTTSGVLTTYSALPSVRLHRYRDIGNVNLFAHYRAKERGVRQKVRRDPSGVNTGMVWLIEDVRPSESEDHIVRGSE